MAALEPETILSVNAPLNDLTAALRARRKVLGLPQLAVDHIAGLAEGYTAKCEARLTNPTARNARAVGWESLPLLLGALKLRLAIVVDDPLRASSTHSPGEKIATVESFFVERARSGGRARGAALSSEERSASARAAARARWAKHRKQESQADG